MWWVFFISPKHCLLPGTGTRVPGYPGTRVPWYCRCRLTSPPFDFRYKIKASTILDMHKPSVLLYQVCWAMMLCYAGDLILDLSLQTWYKSTECFSRLVHVSACACFDFVLEIEVGSGQAASAIPGYPGYPGSGTRVPKLDVGVIVILIVIICQALTSPALYREVP